eukprot:354799-Chlamydomonas_euryale.AAC.2
MATAARSSSSPSTHPTHLTATPPLPHISPQDGDALIKYGERGEELFLIRYGKVRVLRPDGIGGGRVPAAVLRRGQFVGERAVINDRLRSADCVADGRVVVVVLRKADFVDLANPMLAWVIDYDVLSTVLRALPRFSGIKQELLEQVLDLFDARTELAAGAVVARCGEPLDRMHVVRSGDVVGVRPDGSKVRSGPRCIQRRCSGCGVCVWGTGRGGAATPSLACGQTAAGCFLHM